MKDKTLSSKIERIEYPKGIFHEVCYTDAIKDFIKKFKEGMTGDLITDLWWIDRLAGDALIHSPPKKTFLTDTPEEASPRKASGTSGSTNPACTNCKDCGAPLVCLYHKEIETTDKTGCKNRHHNVQKQKEVRHHNEHE